MASASAEAVVAQTSPLELQIRSIRAFASLSDASVATLANQTRVVRYNAGDMIIRQGEPGDAMYAILEGDAEAQVPDPDGQVRFIRRLGTGDVFGEMALLTGEPRSANVLVPEGCQCECLVLHARDMEPTMRANPQVARFLTDILGERLLASNSLRELGKYRIVGELGRGAMARVFDGFHTELGRSVAVKMLNHSLVYEKDFAERFLHEAKLIAELHHPNIVHVYDFTHAYGTWFIVMERLRGMDLNAMIERDGPLPAEQVRSVIEQAASALECAHNAAIIHRDVKPSNMFLEPNGAFKLVDFGIAVTPGDEAFQKEIACTPEYAAPELISGEDPDGRIDIYSLGLSAWTLLAGRDWARGDNMHEIFVKQMIDEVTPIEEIVPGVPADLSRFIRRATAKRPEERYQNCREILADLEQPLVKVDRRPQLMLSAMYSERQAAEVRKLFAEFQERLGALPGVDVRQAELPFH